LNSTINIPVIDIGKDDQSGIIRQIGLACRDFGFFQITGHGINDAIFTTLQQQSDLFFDQSTEVKHRLLRSAENVWGFYDQELTKNKLDWKQVFDVGIPPKTGINPDGVPQWPENLPDFETALCNYMRATENCSFRILEYIMLSLDLTADHVSHHFKPYHSSFLRLNHYPVCENPGAADAPDEGNGPYGIGRHSDSGALTVLYQGDIAGLQILHEGRWITVEPIPNALVINIGDMVQVWTNDKYHAVVHRVAANTAKARFSAPYFFNPSYQTDYAPLPELCAPHGPLYSSINWGHFREQRAGGDYADYGTEIQIAHYKTRSS